jgi:hypothetical protein
MLEFVTFLLAPIGYAGLTLTAVKAGGGAVPVSLLRGVAAVILGHVTLVWIVRYQGQLGEATRHGYLGFLLFHSALLAIVTSVFVGHRLARQLILGAFGVVTVGALGAVFRYEVVAMYRIPVVVCAVIGSIALFRAYRRSRGLAARAA